MSDFTLSRITEKKYQKIPATALTANGSIDGTITITNTYCFKVGQIVTFEQGANTKQAKIQKVISDTQFIVIESDEPIVTKNRLDMSSFTTGATVELTETIRPKVEPLEIWRQVYEEEPTVAVRSHLVDWLGRSYDTTNSLPVESQIANQTLSDIESKIDPTFISAENSSTANLGAGDTFTGEWIDVERFQDLAVTISADQDSAVDGLKIQVSHDGSSLIDEDVYTKTANKGNPVIVPLATKWVRVVYTNGTTPTTSFSLQTKVFQNRPKPSSHRLDDDISRDNDAELVKSVIAGRSEDGIYRSAILSNSGSVEVAITDRPSEVRDRISVNINVARTTLTLAGDVIYDVPAGKTLYIPSFYISQINSSTANGEWTLNDESTEKSTFVLSPRESGLVPASAQLTSPVMPEPMRFSTSIRVVLLSGNMDISGYFIGYLEDD